MWMQQGPLCVAGGAGGGDASESREFLADTAAHVALPQLLRILRAVQRHQPRLCRILQWEEALGRLPGVQMDKESWRNDSECCCLRGVLQACHSGAISQKHFSKPLECNSICHSVLGAWTLTAAGRSISRQLFPLRSVEYILLWQNHSRVLTD